MAEDGSEDNSSGVPPDVVVVPLRVSKELVERLRSFGILDREESVHCVDVEEGLDYFAEFAPSCSVGYEKDVRFVGTDECIADVVIWAGRVD